MVPPKRPRDDDDDEDEDYGQAKPFNKRELASIVRQIMIQQKNDLAISQNESKGDKNSFIYKAKDWISIILTLVAWFASITYLAGGLGQRVSELEIETKTIKDTTMTKDLLDEKFNGVGLRLRSLEERQQDFANPRLKQ